MTVGELREKVLNAGGEFRIGDLIFLYKEGDDIDIRVERGGMMAWVQSGRDNDLPLVSNINVSAGDVFTHFKAIIQLAQFVGADTKGFEAVEVEKKVVEIKEVETPETHRLQGMVEAYETLLVGRSVKIGAQMAVRETITVAAPKIL